jgi:chaperonin GroES
MATAAKKKIELQPLEDRIVIKRLEAETKTAGGIVLPDTAKEKPQRGEILAVGPGKLLDNGKRAELEVKVGDQVLFGKYSGTEVKVAGEECVIMRESDLLAKLG